MATEKFKAKMADLTRDEVVEECFEAVKRLRHLNRELAEERQEVERLKAVMEAMTAREVRFQKEIDFLTCRPLLCSVNTASGQKEEDDDAEEEDVVDVAYAADQQVKVRCHTLQGLVRKRWLDDAMKIRNGELREPLSHGAMKEAASKWVVEAANAAGDESASDALSAWNVQHSATERMFLLFCTDAMGTKKVYPWLCDFSLLYGC